MPIAETVAPDVSRDDFARWIAAQHLSTDPNISVTYYLPTKAKPREVRLIEVNRSLGLASRSGPLNALDFSVDVEGLEPFAVLVADVAPHEWEAIARKELALPRGWCLDSRIEIGRAEVE